MTVARALRRADALRDRLDHEVFTGILLAEMVSAARCGSISRSPNCSRCRVPSRNGRQIRLVDLSTHSSGLPRMPDNFTPADPATLRGLHVAHLYDFLRRHECAVTSGRIGVLECRGRAARPRARAPRRNVLRRARNLSDPGAAGDDVHQDDPVACGCRETRAGTQARGEPKQNWDLARLCRSWRAPIEG